MTSTPPPAEVITGIDQVTAEWLTSVLSKSGALTHGVVKAFDVNTGRGNWSTSARLAVRYAEGSQGARPQRLFLKMVNADLDDEFFGASEVTYYTRDYVGVEGAPLIRCYAAAYSEEKRRYHLLLDDVSETHVEAATKAPTLDYGLALAEGLAALHARWWGAERLAALGTPGPFGAGQGVAGAPIHSAEHIRRFVDIAEPGAGHILNQFPAELQPHWPEMIRAFYAKHPHRMIERTHDLNGFTLIHGDVGHNNILVPRTGERPIYIIDRQPFNWSLTTWLGVYDLAYAIVLDWPVETRRQLEMPVLQHYHQSLLKNGVNNYTREQLVDDYRLCVAMGIYIATEYCRGSVGAKLIPIWLPMLQRSLIACGDLKCGELW
jgi:ecdysteroid kinase